MKSFWYLGINPSRVFFHRQSVDASYLTSEMQSIRKAKPMVGIFFFHVMLMSICYVTVEADVINLTADTFTDKVKEKDTLWFIQFCVPWCKHCKKIDSLWEELGKAVEGEDGVEIAQVDCTTSKPICAKVGIHAYPTFKLFYNGEEYEKYTGPRDVESLKAFVVDKAEKLAKGEADSDEALE